MGNGSLVGKLIAVSVFIVIITVGGVLADIPKMINYQGKVTDGSGVPVVDGSYPMRFWIYDLPTGGSNLWDSGPTTVDVSGGVFSVLLGESAGASIELAFDQDYWLLVRFDGVDQTPRQRLVSTGYAYMASGFVAGTEVIGEVTTGTKAAIKGTNTATAGNTDGVSGWSYSTTGRGVYGLALATTGANYGVIGASWSTSGTGVYGVSGVTTGTTNGVLGATYSGSGYSAGVLGRVESTTPGGYSAGVRGINNGTGGNGIGVYGSQAGSGWGVYGTAVDGSGVYGRTTATNGLNNGVNGAANSISGRGVFGSGAYGVYGFTSSGTAVYGTCDASGFAIRGSNSFGNSGYIGSSSNGVYGFSGGNSTGVYGYSNSGSGSGVRGTSVNFHGVWGEALSTGSYGVYYSGGLAGSGSKSCVVQTSQGSRMLYCQESPESWFEDFGEAQLIDGRTHVELDHLFLETATIDDESPMKVFVQLRDDCRGTYVVTGRTGFDVVELQAGTSSARFAYRVVVKRKGFEGKRLDVCDAARTDPYLHPELKEEMLKELAEERARMEEEHRRMELDRVETEEAIARMNQEGARMAEVASQPTSR